MWILIKCTWIWGNENVWLLALTWECVIMLFAHDEDGFDEHMMLMAFKWPRHRNGEMWWNEAPKRVWMCMKAEPRARWDNELNWVWVMALRWHSCMGGPVCELTCKSWPLRSSSMRCVAWQREWEWDWNKLLGTLVWPTGYAYEYEMRDSPRDA